MLFQETHSSLNDKQQWKDEFNGPLFFSQTAKQILAILEPDFAEKILST